VLCVDETLSLEVKEIKIRKRNNIRQQTSQFAEHTVRERARDTP
jgi:hypothetical protein